MDLTRKINRLGLGPYSAAITAAARPCRVARVTGSRSPSFLGGLPEVEDGFQWPAKEQRPLEFLAQISLADLGLGGADHLLFFWDNYHWGGSSMDKGHAVAVPVSSGKPWSAELPSYEKRSFFGLKKSLVEVRTYAQRFLTFSPSLSFPLELPAVSDEGDFEVYIDELHTPEEGVVAQSGGYPCPVQSDDMEKDCEHAVGLPAEDWSLLLQLDSSADRNWGDAGMLYWFIPSEDLSVLRFDRVWMVMQCH